MTPFDRRSREATDFHPRRRGPRRIPDRARVHSDRAQDRAHRPALGHRRGQDRSDVLRFAEGGARAARCGRGHGRHPPQSRGDLRCADPECARRRARARRRRRRSGDGGIGVGDAQPRQRAAQRGAILRRLSRGVRRAARQPHAHQRRGGNGVRMPIRRSSGRCAGARLRGPLRRSGCRRLDLRRHHWHGGSAARRAARAGGSANAGPICR